MKDVLYGFYKLIKRVQIKKEYKQVILVRQDLDLPKGKVASQAAHAAVESLFNADKEVINKWRSEGAKKIVLKVANEKELINYFQQAKEEGLPVALITDAGKTIVAPGTKTCVGIGPDLEDKIDKITGNLKTF